MHYTVSTNDIDVFRVQSNNKLRDVVLSEHAEFGALCSCLLPEAWRIKCRHILATEEYVPQLKNYECISDIYLTQHFKTAFENYELSLPTPQEIQAAGIGDFPPIVLAPRIKRGGGRPRTKRLRKWYEGLRRKAVMVSDSKNRLRQQWQSLILGTFGRKSGRHRFKDYFYALSAHRTVQGLKLCVSKCQHTGMRRNFRLLQFFFLEMELLLGALLPLGILRGTFSLATSGCRGALIRTILFGCERATTGIRSKSDFWE